MQQSIDAVRYICRVWSYRGAGRFDFVANRLCSRGSILLL